MTRLAIKLCGYPTNCIPLRFLMAQSYNWFLIDQRPASDTTACRTDGHGETDLLLLGHVAQFTNADARLTYPFAQYRYVVYHGIFGLC